MNAMKELILASAILAVAATPVFARPSVCIRQDEIYSWNAINDKQLVIEDRSHKKALLKLVGTCHDFKFTDTIAIRAPVSMGISCVEIGDEVSTRGPGSGIGGRCGIVGIEPYTGTVKKDEHHDDHHDDDHHD
jgi:hypothetical protein